MASGLMRSTYQQYIDGELWFQDVKYGKSFFYRRQVCDRQDLINKGIDQKHIKLLTPTYVATFGYGCGGKKSKYFYDDSITKDNLIAFFYGNE